MNTLTHLNQSGDAHMVDVGTKEITRREATAVGHVKMLPDTLSTVLEGNAKKGDVMSVARIAGIMAAKKTSELIPLCHPIGLDNVEVFIQPDETLPGLRVEARARVSGKTGVEMEALTACSVTCLTIYDMVKALDRGMEISGIMLDEKKGGKSGSWKRGDASQSQSS
ncbi:MAG: cyclic pyranopterin monophosphate synthase MoaC [Pseudomonadota bacterium]